MTTITTSDQAYGSHIGSQETLQPLPFWGSLAAFGIPALLMIFSYHVFMPWLIEAGLAPAESFVVSHVAPMAVMLSVALAVFHRLEGRPLNWAAFSQRFRYPRITIKAVLLGLGTFLALNIAYGAFSQLGIALAGHSLTSGSGPITSVADVLGEGVQGRWEIVVLFLLVLAFNVVGEELWWRGIILPRQELTHGRWP
jgi:membrane protease YdiL (CAAX protease family)